MTWSTRCRGWWAAALAVAVVGCFDDVSVREGDHPCDACRGCERCVETSEGARCEAKGRTKECRDDGTLGSVDSCGEHREVIEACAGSCEVLDGEPTCVCVAPFVGQACDECPGHLDPATQCTTCIGNWTDVRQSCLVCPATLDPTTCTAVCGDGRLADTEACDDNAPGQSAYCVDCEPVPLALAGAADGVDVAMDSQRRTTVAVASRTGGVTLHRYDADGAAADPIRVDEAGSACVALATSPGGKRLVAWGVGSELRARLYDADGRMIAHTVKVIDGDFDFEDRCAVDVAMSDDHGGIVGLVGGLSWGRGLLMREDGSKVEFTNGDVLDFRNAELVEVAMTDDGESLVAWIDYDWLVVQRRDGEGQEIGKELGTSLDLAEYSALALLSDGSFLLAWTEFEGWSHRIGTAGGKWSGDAKFQPTSEWDPMLDVASLPARGFVSATTARDWSEVLVTYHDDVGKSRAAFPVTIDESCPIDGLAVASSVTGETAVVWACQAKGYLQRIDGAWRPVGLAPFERPKE